VTHEGVCHGLARGRANSSNIPALFTGGKNLVFLRVLRGFYQVKKVLKDYIIQLYQYNRWANHRLLDTVARLTEEQYFAEVPPIGRVHAILVHSFGAEALWRVRAQEGISPSGFFDEANYPTLADLTAKWATEESLMQSYITGLTEEALAAPIDYKNLSGQPLQNKLSDILTHVVFHGMQHRSELAIILTSYGASPGNIDFITFLREQ